jgi:hypothetical protein
VKTALWFGILALVAWGPPAAAGESEADIPPTSIAVPDVARQDFLFGAPRGAFAFRGGWSAASAGGEVFDFIRDQLTIEQRDFDAPVWMGEASWLIRPQWAALFRVDYSRSSVASEFRNFIGEDDLPINQETRLTKVGVTLGAKFYLKTRGREIGRFAWVPESFVPYVGVGGGMLWYEFLQSGEFVDFTDLAIFEERFVGEGGTPTFHGFVGADIKLNHRIFLTLELGYNWADAKLRPNFEGFEPLDLAGFQSSVGVDILF